MVDRCHARACRGIGLLLLVGAVVLLAGCDKSPSRPKKSQTVAILPDTPPPPPPPKPEEKRPEPPKEDKPQQQLNQPRPTEAPPQPQALKSDEAAGDGPGSGLQAGAVTQDYKGGAIGIGQGAASDPGPNRLALTSYANAATRQLNDYLARDKDLKRQDYRVRVNLWLAPDGQTQRAELVGSSGDESIDAQLRAALNRFPGTRQPLPDRLPQPLRLMVSNRMIG